VQYYAKVDEHNQLVEQYSALIIPQNKLIARYKKTHNIK
jgi:predicted amidohydrolase